MTEVKISKARLEELLDQAARLEALEDYGVDNWHGYDDALEGYRKEQEVKEFREDLMNDLLAELSIGMYEPAGPGAGHAFGIDAHEMLAKFVSDWNKGE